MTVSNPWSSSSSSLSSPLLVFFLPSNNPPSRSGKIRKISKFCSIRFDILCAAKPAPVTPNIAVTPVVPKTPKTYAVPTPKTAKTEPDAARPPTEAIRAGAANPPVNVNKLPPTTAAAPNVRYLPNLDVTFFASSSLTVLTLLPDALLPPPPPPRIFDINQLPPVVVVVVPVLSIPLPSVARFICSLAPRITCQANAASNLHTSFRQSMNTLFFL
mmetsp:Transcript_2777/g.8977  ORF Transcript_2777/g.8977 Transcript_2777/m.8977 type:complete len:215 (+) Transcript_2777:5252-5896(+)